MRIPSHFSNRSDGHDSKMTPMIDVVFLLLVFFVWTASFQEIEYVLPAELTPSAGTTSEPVNPAPEQQDFDPVVIIVQMRNGQPSWLVNDAPASSIERVRQTLATVAQLQQEIPVIVDPHEDVPLGHVIDVYDAARLVGCSKVQFAAPEKPS